MIPQEGSPPRVRGKGPCRPSGGHLARITPACAGKSSTPPVYHKPRGDHPRVCGEKSFHSLDESALPGSPPRVRGKVMAFSSSDSAFRITPACAGKSKILSSFPKQSWDHPRVCGEKWAAKYKNECNLGSPPRVRGKGEHRQTGDGRRGDHPRVCGEKMFSISGDVKYPGSPPRVRGKDSPENKDISGRGITPACAGKRVAIKSCSACVQDHPRVCGEKTKKIP